MIEGIGMDIVEIERVKAIATRQERFVERILTDAEQQVYHSLSSHRQIEFLAGRFAVKEAIAKAAGTGIGKKLSWQDIEVLYDTDGKPVATVAHIKGNIHISITHSKQYACAQAIIEACQS